MFRQFNTTLLMLGLRKAEDYLWHEVYGTEGAPKTRNHMMWNPVPRGMPGCEWQSELLALSELEWQVVRDLLGHEAYSHIDVRKVNEWLTKFPNVPVKLTERPVSPLYFYVAAHFALKDLTWVDKADESRPNVKGNFDAITLFGKPAFRLDANKCGVRFYDVGFGPNRPLVVIATTNPRISIYAISQDSMVEEFQLIRIIRELGYNMERAGLVENWGGVVFPNLVAKGEVDINEGRMQGLWSISYQHQRVSVVEAKMYLLSVLSPEGPLAEGAAAMGMAKELFSPPSGKPDYEFNKPFVYSFVDSACPRLPYLVTWADPDAFSPTRVSLDQFKK